MMTLIHWASLNPGPSRVQEIVSLILEWIVVQTSCQFWEADLKIRRFLSFQIFQRMKPGKKLPNSVEDGGLKN
jgi:hypothetical protein